MSDINYTNTLQSWILTYFIKISLSLSEATKSLESAASRKYSEIISKVAFLDISSEENYNKTSVWNGKWEILKKELKNMHIIW